MRPLEGVRVLDLSRYAPGLYATTLLADLGAEVVSVEPSARPVAESPLYKTQTARAHGHHPHFRGRRSIVVDLRSAEGVAVVERLIARSDVVVEGFRPGVIDQIGLGFEVARRLNPAIVFCSVTGYGQKGPAAHRPGHDINYVAESGALAQMALDGRPPGMPGNLLADLAGGSMSAALAIVSAVYAVKNGAPAQYLDIAMVRSLLAMVAPSAAMHAVGVPDPAWGQGLLTGAAPFYRCYRTADEGLVSVGAIEPKFFARLCEGLGRPDLTAVQFDQAAWPGLHAEFERRFAQGSRDRWARELQDAAVTPVLTTEEAFARAGDVVADPRPAALTPLPWGPATEQYSRRAGSDTQAVLAELGIDADQTADWMARGVVGVADPP